MMYYVGKSTDGSTEVLEIITKTGETDMFFYRNRKKPNLPSLGEGAGMHV